MTTTLQKYFPYLTSIQQQQFELLEKLYAEWNEKINVVSRKDISHLTLHHILHSLSIAKYIQFKPQTNIMDAGTGGGFPGIPLAILFPETRFVLVDSIGKKIKVVENIAQSLQLSNIAPLNTRFETLTGPFDFITGRAVTNLPQFIRLVKKQIKSTGFNDLPNGILYLTGGETNPATAHLRATTHTFPLSSIFDDPWFSTKKLLHLYNFHK